MARATSPLLRNLNERTVLETIRAGAPISRAEISRRSGISKPTVSLALQSLLEASLVREAAAAIARLRSSLFEASGLEPDRVDGVVVGVPGVVESETGVLRLAENVAGLEGRAFADELQSALGLPVALENDINLAALGEHWQGVAQGVDDFVFLSIGTGMGAGVVLRGELHRGRHGAAGEIDFALIAFDGVDPSAPQVTALAGGGADPRAVFGAAREGDEAARAVVAEVARRIALHIAPF